MVDALCVMKMAHSLLHAPSTPLRGHPDGAIPLYVMTCDINEAETRAYFEEHTYFGLTPERVLFFAQGVLPCVSFAGGFLRDENNKVRAAGRVDGRTGGGGWVGGGGGRARRGKTRVGQWTRNERGWYRGGDALWSGMIPISVSYDPEGVDVLSFADNRQEDAQLVGGGPGQGCVRWGAGAGGFRCNGQATCCFRVK